MFVPLTPLRCLHRAADVFGSRVGVVCGGREFLYREVLDRVERLAAGLASLGVAAGDRVAYLSFTNHALYEGYFGVPQAGAILAPLNVRLSVPELLEILHRARPRVLIYEAEFGSTVEQLVPRCPFLEDRIVIGEEPSTDAMSYEGLLALAPGRRADIGAIDEQAIAELFYTSGSTGSPKGVALSHRTVYLHALDYALTYREPETMVDLVTIPLYHAGGWGRPQASALLGVKQVLVRRFEPETVFGLIEQHRATDVCLVPVMAHMLLDSPALARHDLSSLRQIHIGGAANSPALVARIETAFPTAECSSGYGLTETAPVATHSEPRSSILFRNPGMGDPDRQAIQARTGRAINGVSVRVVDETLQDVPRNGTSVGEILIWGDHVMDGYYDDPGATREAIADGWLKTGDMATWDTDGTLRIVDRKKQMIVSGGETISSAEIEAAITSHPEVVECAVVAAPDDKWGEVPAAIVVARPGAALDEAALLDHLHTRLARFKLPKIVEFQHEPLAKTGTGKVRKHELRERYWTNHSGRVKGA